MVPRRPNVIGGHGPTIKQQWPKRTGRSTARPQNQRRRAASKVRVAPCDLLAFFARAFFLVAAGLGASFLPIDKRHNLETVELASVQRAGIPHRKVLT